MANILLPTSRWNINPNKLDPNFSHILDWLQDEDSINIIGGTEFQFQITKQKKKREKLPFLRVDSSDSTGNEGTPTGGISIGLCSDSRQK